MARDEMEIGRSVGTQRRQTTNSLRRTFVPIHVFVDDVIEGVLVCGIGGFVVGIGAYVSSGGGWSMETINNVASHGFLSPTRTSTSSTRPGAFRTPPSFS